MLTGINHPNYNGGIHSSRKRDKRDGYRLVALETLPNKCSVCGYNVISILLVHHKDQNRENNDIGNLDVLCPTHHREYHEGLRSYS